MEDHVNIAGLDKAEVLLALYNGSHAQGMSFLSLPGEGVTLEQCQKAVEGLGRFYFDYFAGHVIKADLTDDSFDPWLYDRDNGPGAASAAIAKLRQEA